MDRPLQKKKWPPKKIAMVGGGGLFFFFVIYSFIFGDSSSKLNVETEKITIAAVARGPFQEFIPVTGTVLPIKTIYIDAIEGGRVETKFIEAGAFVKEGDKILQLANTDLLLDIMFREAQFFEQSNNLRNTRLLMEQSRLNLRQQLNDQEYQVQRLKRLYERAIELRQKNLISQQEFEQTRDEYEYRRRQKELATESFKQDSLFRQIQVEQLESSLQRMQANLDVTKQRLESMIIRAPVTGQLTSLNAEIGESKAPGQRLGQVDVLDGFKVRAGIDEHYLPRINIGLNGEFDFANQTYKLIVKKVFPEIRDGRFDVDLEFEGKEPEGIRRGQTLHIRLELGDLAEAILLPRGGFYQKTGGQWVYVLDKSGDYATKRSIKLGRQNPQMFEVLEGLEPGERVITSSYDSFGDIDKLVLKK
ncbi:MAG: HlyD family efflux transporter periplasmic adaptor subunit [candidate division KSB1 bacterium]|nr:HlyD family efflux transporter periplasmic adaptor subunit [candidate division KSB1 bacterium]MDZ7368768.1 HlyD family efflux transporter periplasmic adaptor subunit [candidate division KSB1 bacterium]MDZ7406578.1 HlyD family efflux transporter periplasmic adaptor subunit [candidate division KSB1 bacterium]